MSETPTAANWGIVAEHFPTFSAIGAIWEESGLSARLSRAHTSACDHPAPDVASGDRAHPLVFLRRLRLADNEPMAIQSTFLPSSLVPGLLDLRLENASLYQVLQAQYGLKIVDAQTSASADLASEEEAALLQLPLPAALLATEQITFLDDGRPIEFARSLYRGDRYRLQPAPRKPPTR